MSHSIEYVVKHSSDLLFNKVKEKIFDARDTDGAFESGKQNKMGANTHSHIVRAREEKKDTHPTTKH